MNNRLWVFFVFFSNSLFFKKGFHSLFDVTDDFYIHYLFVSLFVFFVCLFACSGFASHTQTSRKSENLLCTLVTDLRISLFFTEGALLVKLCCVAR